ncbi:hypothetical protein HKX48_004466 [Thoreauomyces humboldtii]|nr:hypothetical protein HKX48_004466 [Thoreauomyces humboldtii]
MADRMLSDPKSNDAGPQPQAKENRATEAIKLAWTFGVNTGIVGGIHALDEKTIFYTSAHTGVIYDHVAGTQQSMLGHCNQITAVTTSHNKRFLVTADRGYDPLLIVWDTSAEKELDGVAPIEALPIRTIFDPHGGSGVVAVAFTRDSRYLVSLGADTPQTIAVWDWSTEEDEPIASAVVEGELQTSLMINPADPYEMLTTSSKAINFYTWSEDGKIGQYVPSLNPKDFKHIPTSYTHSTFLPTTPHNTIGQALTATADGDIVVWTDRSLFNLSETLEKGRKAGVKVMKLHTGGINMLTVIGDKYLVTGGEDGFVRVYDLQFRLIVWFERLRSGPIASISTTLTRPLEFPTTIDGSGNVTTTASVIGSDIDPTDLPDLLISTRHSRILKLAKPGVGAVGAAGNPNISTLMEGAFGEMQALIVHPSKPQFTIGGDTAIGFTNGTVRIVDPSTLLDFPQRSPASHRAGLPGYAVAKSAILRIVFDPRGRWMAVTDALSGVGVFEHNGKEWGFVGRSRAHYLEIVGLLFVPPPPEQTVSRLISVSADRHMVEYDLAGSSITTGIAVHSKMRIEQTNRPESATLHPSPPLRGPHDAPQYYLLTSTSGSKFRLYNAETGMCRRTVVAPAYGGTIRHLEFIPVSDSAPDAPRFLAYATASRVVGLIALPLDGNPHAGMGMYAHPSDIAALRATPDGKMLLTLGRTDGVVNLWNIDTNYVTPPPIKPPRKAISPWLDLLHTGANREAREAFVREMEDYFYYAQLRSQGEETTSSRQITQTVSLEQVPLIMQAMGYYPSQAETDDMLNEVRYAGWFEGADAELRSEVGFEELVRLYVNHRPLQDYTQNEIFAALGNARRMEPGVAGAMAAGETTGDGDDVGREGLVALLQQYGETLSAADFDEAMQSLLLNDPEYRGIFPDRFTKSEFVESVLGMVAEKPLASSSMLVSGAL